MNCINDREEISFDEIRKFIRSEILKFLNLNYNTSLLTYGPTGNN